MKKINLFYMVGLLALLPMTVEAQTVATVANTVLDQIHSIPKVIGGICYVAGVWLGVVAALKFKEHNESKGQIKITAPIIYTVAAVLLLSLPTFLNVGIETFGYDKASQSTSKY